MYLSNLELVGFKSFAQKTSFKFSDGITVFVGPNGSGKTNIVDAVRWVLGEQKTSLLRSDIMENVIFCGSKHRKPIGMAEVSLTIQNNKKILPIEYSEITITRRLFRNGESQYLINNTICRLRDITDLFMDTGIGSDSYSVIELKMVEDILNGKIEERRHLVEEAAGVTKYKIRKKEADKKLISVQADIIRLQDIVEEVKKNVSSLSRQAAKTKKYNQIIDEYKSLELALLKNQHINLNSLIKSNIEQIKEKKIEKNKYHNTIEELEDEIRKIEIELAKLNELHTEANNIENRLYNELVQMNKDLAVGEERISSIINSTDKMATDIIEIKNNIQNLEFNLAKLKENYNQYNNQLKDKSTDIETQKSEVHHLKQSVLHIKHSVNQKSDELQSIKNSITNSLSLVNKNKQRFALNNKRIDDSINEIRKEKALIAELELQTKQFTENKDILSQKKTNILKEYKEKTTLRESYSESLEKYQNEILKIKNDIGNKQNTFDFLRNLISSDETSRFLIESRNWLPSKEKPTLAEIIATNNEYCYAVESALGEAGKWFVVDNLEQAESAIQLLKQNSKGKATFIILDKIPKTEPFEELYFKNKKVIWLCDIVRAEPKIKNLLRIIFGKTCIADSIENAFEIIEHNIADSAVTLDGAFLNKNGFIKGGAINATETTILGKKERMQRLCEDIDNLNQQLKELENAYYQEKAIYSSINLGELEEKLDVLNEKINANENSLSQVKYQIISLNNKVELIEHNIAELKKDNFQIEEENKNVEKQLLELESQKLIINEELTEANNSLLAEEEKLEEQEMLLHSKEIEIAKLQTEVKNLQTEILNTEKQIQFNKDRLQDIEIQKQKSNFELENIKRRLTIINGELNTTEAKHNEATGKKEHIIQSINSKQDQLRQISEQLTLERKTYSKVVDSIHQIELKISEYNTQLSQITQKALEDYKIDLQNINIKLEENFSTEETKVKLAILKEKLNSLGSVNFMALDEFEEQNKRLEFLISQINDLTDSEKTLQETIKEINQTAEEMFRHTFDKVNQNFKILFKKLFGNEGDADMRLTNDNDPLESNIEIIAKPPGKKPYSIDVLSGGEKTLIAIALLFAIYLVKPSPFCILDEVDAPLDDSNIDKYLELIKSFSDNTQFLIITHNKKTMEAADTLYGITMVEDGVSQVVSVKFAS